MANGVSHEVIRTFYQSYFLVLSKYHRFHNARI